MRHPITRPALVAAVAAILAVVVATTAGADVASPVGPAPSVTKVDATSDAVELFVAGPVPGVADIGPSDVALQAGGQSIDITGLSSSQDEDRPTEIVLVVDTNARSAQGEILERMKATMIDFVQELSPATSVAVVSAGDNAVVLSRMTDDRSRIVQAIDGLAAKNGSVLYNAIDRAGALLGSEPGVVRSVVVVSTGPDTGSDVTLADAQVTVVQRGAQLVSVRYDGGAPALASTVERTAGAELSIQSESELEPVLDSALAVAADRLLVTFAAPDELGTRTNLALTVSGAETSFSYPAGVIADNPLQLTPQSLTEPTGVAFFRTSAGLYIALALAFAGISLGVWSLGSIMAGGEANLEGVLSRYTEAGIEGVDGEELEELIVQSALLQRAVSFSEAFAEKRGFLARVEELLERANLPIRAGEAMFILAAIGVLSSGLGLVVTRSVVAAVLFGVAATSISFFVVRLLGRRRFKAFESQLPDTLQLLSGTLRAGYSLPQGLEVVSKEIADPMGQELRRAMTEARLGRDLEESLSGVADRLTSADFAWTVMAINIQREVGGNLNELLNSVADTMIARERLKREIGALTAEGRMSAGVLSFLPPGLGVVMWIMNPEYVGVLFSEFMGNVMLGMGVVSALIGLAWMKKVITVDV